MPELEYLFYSETIIACQKVIENEAKSQTKILAKLATVSQKERIGKFNLQRNIRAISTQDPLKISAG